jgi:hypothetical protein
MSISETLTQAPPHEAVVDRVAGVEADPVAQTVPVEITFAIRVLR